MSDLSVYLAEQEVIVKVCGCTGEPLEDSPNSDNSDFNSSYCYDWDAER